MTSQVSYLGAGLQKCGSHGDGRLPKIEVRF